MNIIIPLGGKGERFVKEGYTVPKPLIKVLDKEILFYVIDNLEIDDNDKIFIIYNKDLDIKDIVSLKYPKITLIKLERDTKGAAETVYIGITEILKLDHNKKTILIDGDTFYTENIIKMSKNCDSNAIFYQKNYDECPIYSYINFDADNIVNDIREKYKISHNANTGAYMFNDINVLLYYSMFIVENDIKFNNECYTSCIICEMIKNNETFLAIELTDVHVLGTPKQVNEFILKNEKI